MTSSKLIQSTTFNNFFSSRPVIDVPVDGNNDEVVVTASVKTLCIDTRSGLLIVGLAGGFIVLFAGVVIDGLADGMIGVGVDMLAEFGIVVVVAAVSVLNVFVTVSRVGDVWAGV